jgi:hypothetical protein
MEAQPSALGCEADGSFDRTMLMVAMKEFARE